MNKATGTVIMVAGLARLAAGATPAFSLALDTQRPDREWSIRWVYAGTTPLVRANLYQSGAAYTPSADWVGAFLWYGTNTDWKATSTVKVTGSVSTSVSYIDFQAAASTFPTDGNYYGGVVMTNAGSTRIIEWGLGRVYVRTSGGVGSPGVLSLTGSTWATQATKGAMAYDAYVSNIVAGAGVSVTVTGRTAYVASTATASTYCGTNVVTGLGGTNYRVRVSCGLVVGWDTL